MQMAPVPVKLTKGSANGRFDWSPDSSKVVLASHRELANEAPSYLDIYVIDFGGSNVKRLTHIPDSADADAQRGIAREIT